MVQGRGLCRSQASPPKGSQQHPGSQEGSNCSQDKFPSWSHVESATRTGSPMQAPLKEEVDSHFSRLFLAKGEGFSPRGGSRQVVRDVKPT
jgi:hypothetical protein